MTIVEIGKRLYTVPEKWNELTGRQLIDVLVIMHMAMPFENARLHLFKKICGATWMRLWWCGVEEFEDKLYLTDWLLGENTLTDNLIKSYQGHYGPAGSFNNLVISEFIFTEQQFAIWKSDEPVAVRHDALNRLVAILYRPEKKNYDKIRNESGDIREAFNDNLIDYYTTIIATWPFQVKQAIVFWYEGCHNQLIRDFPKVFGGGGSGESVYGLWDVLFSIAEKNVLGDFAKVENQLLKTVLMVITKTVADAERIEQQLKKPGK